MYALSMFVLAALTLLAFIPVLKLQQYRDYETFTPLRYLVNVVFAWAVLMVLKYITADDYPVLGYYLHLFSYVVVVMTVMGFYHTIMSFMNHRISKITKTIGFVYLGIFTFMVAVNDLTHWIVIESSGEVSNLNEVLALRVTPLFNIHALILYLVLIIPIGMLLIYLKSKSEKKLYKVPFLFFLSAVVTGIGVNLIHLYVYAFYLDPTFVVMVVFSFMLYHIIYHKDMRFIMMAESRRTLIDSMREMYIVTDENGYVIDCSDELMTRFNIDKRDHVDAIIDILSSKAILYDTIATLDDKSSALPYLYTIKKVFTLDKIDHKGILYLFYDETKFVKIFEQLEFLQSHDEMTNLYNRNYFERNMDALQAAYSQSALIIADINGLKLFNDYYGHKGGDSLILRFADILKSLVPDEDNTKIMRVGGDEFLIFIGGGTEKDAESIMESILEQTYHEDPLQQISTSVGYAIWKPGEHLETTFLRADKALYVMKKETSGPYKNAFKKAFKAKKD